MPLYTDSTQKIYNMKSTISLLVFILFLHSNSSYGNERTWILFANKDYINNNLGVSLDSLESKWSPRSLKRRAKAGIGLSIMDSDINQDYISAVTDLGAEVVCRSKWMNAISVVASNQLISKIEKFDFVQSTQSVASYQLDSNVMDDANNSLGKEHAVIEYSDIPFSIPLGDYGLSYVQDAQSGAVEAHRRGFTGKGVLLGMLDTGFQLDHRAFAGIDLVAQYDFIFGDSDPSYDPRTDKRGQANHGTACLSVIVGKEPGRLVGIAPGVSVALAKTELTGSELRIEEDYWVEAIEWLEWLGVDVVSSSLSYRKWYSKDDYNGVTPFITRAAARACELGVIICNSAGNDGPQKITIGAPADAVDVLAIAAVDSNGIVTGFSSRGPTADGRIKPDVAALGRAVVCVKPMTWNEYSRWNGTSLSCPIAAGVVALIIEAHPDWSPSKVREALRSSSDRSQFPDLNYGYGIINAAKAIDYPTVLGRVIDASSGNGLGGLKVNLISNEYNRSCITKKTGMYSFCNVPDKDNISLKIYNGDLEIFSSKNLHTPPSIYKDIIVDMSIAPN